MGSSESSLTTPEERELEEIYGEKVCLNEDVLAIIKRLHRNDPTLIELDLYHDYTRRGYLHGIGVEAAQAIAKALWHSTHLKKLILTVQCFGYEGLLAILEALVDKASSASSVEFLDLSRMHLVGNLDTMKVLEKFLVQSTTVQTLCLSFFRIEPDAAALLDQSVTSSSSLRTLKCMDFVDGSCFQDMLGPTSPLKELLLYDCKINDKHAKNMFSNLERNTSLERLVVYRSSMGFYCVNYICNFLAKNQTLKVLDVRETKMGKQGVSRIFWTGVVANHNYTLEELYLDKHSGATEGETKESSFLKARLLLKQSDIQPKVWAAVLGHLSSNPTMIHYLLRENRALFQA